MTTLVLSGAGVNLSYEIGAAAEIQKTKDINKIIGTSAGSIIGVAIAVGWNLDQLIPILINRISGERSYDGSFWFGCLRLLFKDYMFETDLRTQMLDIILKDNPDITFDQCDFDITIVATNFITADRILMNRSKTPKLTLREAAMASSSIMGIFKPVYIQYNHQELKLADGGFCDYFATDLGASDYDPNTTVGVLVRTVPPTKTTIGLVNLFQSLFYVLTTGRNNITPRNCKVYICYITNPTGFFAVQTRDILESAVSMGRSFVTNP